MDTFIEYLLNQIKNKGIRGIIPIISIVILGLLFISPSYTFIFFYKRSLFLDYDLIINVITVVILDILLFLILFVIGSLRDIETDNEGNFIDNGTLSKDIIMTIVLMGVVSIYLVTVYGIYVIAEWSINTIDGVKNLYGVLSIIFLYYFLPIVKKIFIK